MGAWRRRRRWPFIGVALAALALIAWGMAPETEPRVFEPRGPEQDDHASQTANEPVSEATAQTDSAPQVASGAALVAGAGTHASEPDLVQSERVDASTAGASIPPQVLTRLPATPADLDRLGPRADSEDDTAAVWPTEWVTAHGEPTTAAAAASERFRLDYTLHPILSRSILRMLERQKVKLGQVLIADARTGRLLTYVVTDPVRFGLEQTYPAASLAKVVTAAAVLERSPDVFDETCVFAGSPYRLTESRLSAPRRGRHVTMLKALATSNNQCFGRLAVHTLGAPALTRAFAKFGWLQPVVSGFPAGRIEETRDDYALAQLGSGLAGTSITPLHALELALALTNGTIPTPFWIRGVHDAAGTPLGLPRRAPPRRAMPAEVADRLRNMLVETTMRGTARRAFRLRSGRPLLQKVRVAGKTGSLSGTDPEGRYEWFAGVAPANAPRIAIAVVSVHGDFFLQTASQLAAESLRRIFCPKGVCSEDAADAWLDQGGQELARR